MLDFAVPADHRAKKKEIKMIDKCKNLARELKKLFNIKVTVILIRDQLEYSEESWRPQETSCHSNSSERPPAVTGMKNSQGMKK